MVYRTGFQPIEGSSTETSEERRKRLLGQYPWWKSWLDTLNVPESDVITAPEAPSPLPDLSPLPDITIPILPRRYKDFSERTIADLPGEYEKFTARVRELPFVKAIEPVTSKIESFIEDPKVQIAASVIPAFAGVSGGKKVIKDIVKEAAKAKGTGKTAKEIKDIVKKVETPPIVGEPPKPPIPPEPVAIGAVPPEPIKFPSGKVPGGIQNIKVIPDEANALEKVTEALTPNKLGLRDSVTEATDKLMRKTYAYWYPLRDLAEKAGTSVDKIIQLVPGAVGAGQDIIRTSIAPIWKGLGNDVKYLEEYMTLMRYIDITTLNPQAVLPGKMRGMPETLKAIGQLQTKLGLEKFGKIKTAAEKLWAANDEYVLKPLLDEGIINSKTYTTLKANHPHYIPFERADFVSDINRSFKVGEATVSSNTLQKMSLAGSERKLDQPLARKVADVIGVQRTLARNQAAKAIVGSLLKLDESQGTKLVKILKTGEQGEHSSLRETISFFFKGEKITAEVPAIYGQVANGMEKEAANGFQQLGRILSAPLKAGAVTYNPAFLVINPIRDGMSAFFREGLIPFEKAYWQGWNAAIFKNPLYSEAAKNKVLMSGIVENMTNISDIARVGKFGAITVKNPWDALLVPLKLYARGMEKANIAGEQATRLATFAKLKAKGIEPIEAAVRSRDVTVDFAKMGTTVKLINDWIPFANASLQGSVNVLRTIRDKPVWAIAASLPLGYATMLSRMNNMRFETSKMIPEYEYTNYWVFQYGEYDDNKGNKAPLYIKIPKGQIGSMVTFPIEAMYNLAQKNDDRSSLELFLTAGQEALKATSPVPTDLSGILPPIVKTGVSIATNQNLYADVPIIPRGEQQLSRRQQFGAETSAAAVAAGQALNISPRLLEFAIKDYMAGAGQAASWFLGAALEAVGYKPEVFGSVLAEKPTNVENISRIPIVNRFFGAKKTGAENIGWDMFGKAVEETNLEFSKIPEVNALGIRLGQVDTEINKIELTPQQRAQYQRITAQEVINGLNSNMGQLARLEPKEKEVIARKLMEAFRASARAKFTIELRGKQVNQPAQINQQTKPSESDTYMYDSLNKILGK